MKSLLVYFFFISIQIPGHSQVISSPREIRIYNLDRKEEFSAMASKADTLLLFGQRKTDSCYYVKKSDVDLSINSKAALKLRKLKIEGLDDFERWIERTTNDEKAYDGIEAAVVIGNTIFLAIECTKKFRCYILKGLIKDDKLIFELNDTLSLPKPDFADENDGFESLVQLTDSTLLTVFETDKPGSKGKVYEFNANLEVVNSDIDIYFPDRVVDGQQQRITEICRYNNSLLAIDFTIKLPHHHSEYSVTRLAMLNRNAGILNVENYSVLHYIPVLFRQNKELRCINFEGMVQFKDGILVISDDWESDDNVTHLYYYKFTSTVVE